MNPDKKRALYLIYIFAAIAFFGYYLFPSNAVKKYVTYHLNKTRSDFRVSIDDVKTSFPPGIRLQDVSFYHLNMPLMSIEEIKICPEILSLFRPKTVLRLKGKAYEGVFAGETDLSGEQSERRITVDIHLSDIQIRDIPALQSRFDHKICGILDGKINCLSNGGVFGTANAEFCISDCKVELLTPVFRLKDFTFKKIDTHMILENQNLQIRKCVIKGMQMDGSVGGAILLKYPGGNSVLDLDGILNPHPLFLANLQKTVPVNLFLKKRTGKNRLEFRIKGTIDHPEWSLK